METTQIGNTKWNLNLDFNPDQTDKRMHMVVSSSVAMFAKMLGWNDLQAFLASFVGFGITKEIVDSFTHYGDINDLVADAIGASIGSFLHFDLKF
jgi:VanZ family protein